LFTAVDDKDEKEEPPGEKKIESYEEEKEEGEDEEEEDEGEMEKNRMRKGALS
jgi:hypothetical protein